MQTSTESLLRSVLTTGWARPGWAHGEGSGRAGPEWAGGEGPATRNMKGEEHISLSPQAWGRKTDTDLFLILMCLLML